MREAKFILPVGNGGAGHEYAKQALLNAFGGYTRHAVCGAWTDAAGNTVYDQSVQYVVGMDVSGTIKFREIAMEAGRLEKQQAVYIVNQNGYAEIVDIVVKTTPAEHPSNEGTGLPDRIVRPDKNNGENLPVQLGDLWKTRDGTYVRIVAKRTSGKAHGEVLDGSKTSGSTIVYEAHDGYVDMLEHGPHPMHLVKLLDRQG